MTSSKGNFLGEIEPFKGRWIWPFNEMEEGDWFTVDNQLRPHGKVMNLAHVTAHRLGKRFSVTQLDGLYTKVECVPQPAEPEIVTELKLGQAMQLVSRCYRDIPHPVNTLEWTSYPGEIDEVPARQVEEPKIKRFVINTNANRAATVGVELFEDRIRITGLKPGTTLDEWIERDQQALLED